MTIRSPLSAIGAVIVLIQGICAGALFAVSSQTLQLILVVLIILVTLVFTGLVFWLIVHLVRLNPAYLFNPRDINPAVHSALYILQPDNIEVKLENNK